MSKKISYKELEQRVRDLEKENLSYNLLKDELKQSKEKHQTVLDVIVEGYYEVDLEGNFVFFNGAMHDILGFEKDEMMGMNNQKYMEKETARKVFKTYHKVFQTGKPSKIFEWIHLKNTP